jgi:uncharacterized spore protein YtfJ
MDASAILAKLGDSLTAGRVFGEPIERDGCTLIPVAFVAGGGGLGTNQGLPPGTQPPAVPTGQKQQAPGEGGGFGMVCWPIGAYVIKGGHVRFVPSFDIGQVILLGSAATAKILKALRGGRRRRRALGRG